MLAFYTVFEWKVKGSLARVQSHEAQSTMKLLEITNNYCGQGSRVDVLEHEKIACCSPSTVSGYKNRIAKMHVSLAAYLSH